MTTVEKIEQDIRNLSPEELIVFREWYAEFDAEAWDRQFEADAKSGKFDALAERALREYAEGKTTEL